ncbi:MAG: ABC transporter substrate binding protein [bacterium]|nr:ABC transporter substrate binding protein [bacterium]
MRASMFSIRKAVSAALLAALALTAAPAAVDARTVGLILPKDCAFSDSTKEKFGAALRSQGFSSQDLEIFMQRPGSDKVSRLNGIRKFLAIGADVIVVWGGTSIKEIASESGKTPIVFVGVWDPVASGIVTDLKKPGKYITGIAGRTSTDYLLDNIVESTGIKVLGLMYHSGLVDSLAQYDDVKKMAPGKGLQLLEVDLQTAPKEKAALVLGPAPFLYLAQGCDVEGGVYEALASLNKPAATQNPGITGGGVVFTLAPDMDETIKTAAEITGSILNGKKPGDIPVARITRISFIINMGEARKLDVKVPFPVLNRATEVIR